MKGMRYVAPVVLIIAAVMELRYALAFLSTNPSVTTFTELCFVCLVSAGAAAAVVLIGFGMYAIRLGGRIK
jgi:hypothetical protein